MFFGWVWFYAVLFEFFEFLVGEFSEVLEFGNVVVDACGGFVCVASVHEFFYLIYDFKDVLRGFGVEVDAGYS